MSSAAPSPRTAPAPLPSLPRLSRRQSSTRGTQGGDVASLRAAAATLSPSVLARRRPARRPLRLGGRREEEKREQRKEKKKKKKKKRGEKGADMWVPPYATSAKPEKIRSVLSRDLFCTVLYSLEMEISNFVVKGPQKSHC